VKITILVEGRTEKAFAPHLREFLRKRLAGPMPNIDFFPCEGRIFKEEKLRRAVEDLLRNGRVPSDAVIALTDVYTGTDDFRDAADAKRKMIAWVGENERFHPHAAQHDFEAWLLPFWGDIQELAGHKKGPPRGSPECVNHSWPPSSSIREIRIFLRIRSRATMPT
jgi:integrase